MSHGDGWARANPPVSRTAATVSAVEPLPPDRSHRLRTTPIATSPTPIETIRTRVGKRPRSTKPVRKVPVMAPTVPTAESRPTIEPLVARSVSVPRTSIGAVAERMAAGTTNAVVARRTIRDQPLPQPDATDQPDDRHRGDGAETTEDEGRTEEWQRTDGVRGPPAEPGAEGDAGQDRADDPGVGRERDADVRRQESPGGDLQDKHARCCDERQEGGDERLEVAEPGARGRDRPSRNGRGGHSLCRNGRHRGPLQDLHPRRSTARARLRAMDERRAHGRMGRRGDGRHRRVRTDRSGRNDVRRSLRSGQEPDRGPRGRSAATLRDALRQLGASGRVERDVRTRGRRDARHPGVRDGRPDLGDLVMGVLARLLRRQLPR